MKKHYDLLDVDLKLFDGGEGGASGAEGGTQAGSAVTQPGRSARVGAQGRMDRSEGERRAAGRPGDQPETEGSRTGSAPNPSVTTGGNGRSSDAGSGQGAQPQDETPEQRKARYKALVGGEFKDLFTADTQRIINDRFKETRGLQEALAAQGPVMEFLMSKYQAKDPAGLMAAIQADESQWQAMADAAGKTVEQFRSDYMAQRQREAMDAQLRQSRQELFFQRQMAAWGEEAKAVQAAYPDFDFEAACDDRDFMKLLRSGVPMKLAYEVQHMPDIVAGASRAAADERERAVTEAIRARGGRPPENGASAQNGVTSAVDVGALTREQRMDIAKRAARGEKITFN